MRNTCESQTETIGFNIKKTTYRGVYFTDYNTFVINKAALKEPENAYGFSYYYIKNDTGPTIFTANISNSENSTDNTITDFTNIHSISDIYSYIENTYNDTKDDSNGNNSYTFIVTYQTSSAGLEYPKTFSLISGYSGSGNSSDGDSAIYKIYDISEI